ncbi:MULTISPECIES: hypothetical protein [Colwellia]|uniref:AraC family transcriptional regulator n=1 Tax=Colwellia marinimaniae TaxID=1513592 RepID=A0ABQ0MSH4_9GAMM|nr:MULTISPECIES: hypothetical protein [Colwellia]GAW95326.1 AraC family transcriptional regulator [Colwellia marinimaniae]
MTVSLSIQTKSSGINKARADFTQAYPRTVLPTSAEFKPMTQIVSHTHPWSQLSYSCIGVMPIETDVGIFVIPPEQAL